MDGVYGICFCLAWEWESGRKGESEKNNEMKWEQVLLVLYVEIIHNYKTDSFPSLFIKFSYVQVLYKECIVQYKYTFVNPNQILQTYTYTR